MLQCKCTDFVRHQKCKTASLDPIWIIHIFVTCQLLNFFQGSKRLRANNEIIEKHPENHIPVHHTSKCLLNLEAVAFLYQSQNIQIIRIFEISQTGITNFINERYGFSINNFIQRGVQGAIFPQQFSFFINHGVPRM